ncbi:MAG: glycosyltransferase family 2 protein [Chloroflexi bacterium]|nr:glycosyltransferase family 2 protein [Chloroflexota bacterium]MBV9897220.1 glycosyltransferase family 2 protein [Chloroflexota bacterium]
MEAAPQIDLSIVVLNYNTREHLRACLHALRAEGSPSIETEVLVVDNASADGSVEMVATEFPWARLVRSLRNGGFAFGNNQALRLARGDAILVLNPDTLIPPGGLGALLDVLRQHPEAGIVGPKLLRPDGSIHLACRRSFPTPSVAFYRLTGLSRLFPKSQRFGRYNLTYIEPDVPIEVDSVCGACLLIRRSVVDRIGLLDERFFMYGEDLDWCLRTREAGWTVRYEPSIVVRHQHGAASRQRAFRTNVYFFRAMDLFYRKHYIQRYHPLLTGVVRTSIYAALGLAMCRTLLTNPSQRRVGL